MQIIKKSSNRSITRRLTHEMQQTTATTDSTLPTQTMAPSRAMGAHILPPPPNRTVVHYEMNIQLTDHQLTTLSSENGQLKNVINEKIRNKEFFYGLEMMARTYQPNSILDYNGLGPLLPLFTSIVWLGLDYWDIESLEDIEAIHVARKLDPHVMVMPHFSCYRLTEERLRQFLSLNFANVLSVRGDYYETDQTYKYSSELVEAIRRLRGDSITIAVAGYPEGHPECSSMDEDMENMIKKVSAGADFIITQICFSSRSIIEFIKHCRSKGIQIPILVGIFVPDNFRMLETMLRITKIKMPLDELQEYRHHHELGETNFTDFAITKAVSMIDSILTSDEVEVYGLQFFSMNRFQNIPKVLQEIHNKKENNNKEDI